MENSGLFLKKLKKNPISSLKFGQISDLKFNFFLIFQKKSEIFQNLANWFILKFIWANFEQDQRTFCHAIFTRDFLIKKIVMGITYKMNQYKIYRQFSYFFFQENQKQKYKGFPCTKNQWEFFIKWTKIKFKGNSWIKFLLEAWSMIKGIPFQNLRGNVLQKISFQNLERSSLNNWSGLQQYFI